MALVGGEVANKHMGKPARRMLMFSKMDALAMRLAERQHAPRMTKLQITDVLTWLSFIKAYNKGLQDYYHHESTQLCRIRCPKGRKLSRSHRHYPKPDPGYPNYCNHQSMQPRPIPRHRGASHRENCKILAQTGTRDRGLLPITKYIKHAAL